MRNVFVMMLAALMATAALACGNQGGDKASADAPAKGEAAKADKAPAKDGAKKDGEKPGAIKAPAKKEEAKKEEAKKDAPSATAQVGQAAPDFALKDESGKEHKLSDYKGKVVVLEWTCPTCPYVVRHYKEKTMENTFKKLGDKVVWLAVDSSNFVKADESAKWKKTEGFSYPVLQDPSGKVGKTYEAKTTPHMYVIDDKGTLVYSGAIDDNPRGNKEGEVKNYVEEVVGAILKGEKAPVSSTKPYGCSVKYGS